MERVEITPPSWRADLESFSRQHEGWIVSITTTTPGGVRAVAAHDVPLRGVSPSSENFDDIAIVTGSGRSHWEHTVHDPTAMEIELSDDRAERALIIHARDGSTTTVAFRSPMHPEEVDGVPFSNGR